MPIGHRMTLLAFDGTCPKCGEESGDGWGQCGGKCPMDGSPHFNPSTKEKYLRIAAFKAELDKELPDA